MKGDHAIIKQTKLPGVLLIIPEVFEDPRGHYVMTYNENLYRYHRDLVEAKIPRFVEQDISTSHKGVLRGIHVDPACHKLITVMHGKIYYVVVDSNEGSPTFGNWEAFILSGENHHQIYKPAAYGAGFLALTDDVVFHYMQSRDYGPERQLTVRYDDPRFRIWWPLKDIGLTEPVLSRRDIVGNYVD